MALRPSSTIAALLLIQALMACSTASGPSLEGEALVEPAAPPPVKPPVRSVTALEANIAEMNELVRLVSDPGPLDERFLRPPLAIDQNAAPSLPEALPDGAKISYVVVDLDRGTTITERAADHHHIPASSAKLATAVVALDLLGPNHRFRTELRTNGTIRHGVLKGDLILKGSGDPVLDLPDLLPLIDALARSQVHSIEGRFLIDDSLLPRFTEIDPSQPGEAAYNPGLGALSIAFNRVNLRWNKKKALSVETVPYLNEASFEMADPDRLPPSGVQLKRLDGDKAVWQLADRGARQARRSLPVKDPGLHAGQVFADLARLYGIDLPAPQRAASLVQGDRVIAVHESRPLRELVRDMLWYSNNLVAEMIGLAASRTVDANLTSLDMSAEIILTELEQQLTDIAWDDARLANHSGLSNKTRLSPNQLAAILRHGWNDGMLSSLLPGSGWSGTLARRFNGQDQALRIWAKTGSINYVTTLGGYLLSPSEGPAAFVIMISDEQARAAYDAQPRRTRAIEKKARTWQKNAEEAMNQVVEHWLTPSYPELKTSMAMSEAVGGVAMGAGRHSH